MCGMEEEKEGIIKKKEEIRDRPYATFLLLRHMNFFFFILTTYY